MRVGRCAVYGSFVTGAQIEWLPDPEADFVGMCSVMPRKLLANIRDMMRLS